jgi:MraZ protein
MFLGQYTYTLDDKGRLTIPSRFREELSGRVVVTRGLDRCLSVYPTDVWREIAQKVTALPITNPRGRSLRRIFFADAIDAQLDTHGRILIPDRLRTIGDLELSSEVTIIGLDSFIELWNPDRWEATSANQLEAVEQNPGMWEDLDI